ncbi:hypothetical protein BU23DRAFT_429674, partial [Bimuria novae-zelandiae CBS 107.79]
ASGYAGHSNQGWTYIIEAVHFFRILGFYHPEVYEQLQPLEREFCQRIFWLFYKAQVYDRLTTSPCATTMDPTINPDTALRIIRKVQVTLEQLPNEL